MFQLILQSVLDSEYVLEELALEEAKSNAFRELQNKKILKVKNGMLKVEENYMIKLDSIIDFLINS